MHASIEMNWYFFLNTLLLVYEMWLPDVKLSYWDNHIDKDMLQICDDQ